MGTDGVKEAVEHRSAVMRARRCLGMVLDREDGLRAMLEPFDGTVVEVDMSHLELRSARNPLFFASNSESVVLRRDQNVARREILHRMISAAVTVGHFHGLCPVREP
jgi:hypothetical protein